VQSGCHSGEGRNLSAEGGSAFGGKISKQDASLRWHDTHPERLPFFEEVTLKISITGKHIYVRGGMKSYIEGRIEKLEHLFSAADTAHALLKTEKYIHTAEVSLHGRKLHVFAEGSSEENMYVAIDRAVDRIANQIRRKTGRLKERVHQGKSLKQMEECVELVVEREMVDAQKMTPEQAAFQLEEEDRNFLVFQNPRTHQLNVIYQKKNGKYGVIEPNTENQ
ncbi:MAG: ribosome-associated translation inhibitor RaiA, partial [Candidatus Omnitrophica bacterium]|nr:ribosome-associated translation inhibitor RaiA [Candidatus Omnitrophota bacterium]